MQLAQVLKFPLKGRGLPCVLHKYHYPMPVRPTEDHHIQPKFMHGTGLRGNIAPICPTGHDNVHQFIDWLLENNDHIHLREGKVNFDIASLTRPAPSVTRSERALAIRGWVAWRNMGAPALLPRKATR